MSNEINLLLRQTKDVSASLNKRIHIVRYIALGMLFVVPTTVVILFLFIFFSPLPSLQQQEKNLIKNSQLFQSQAARVQYVNDRTGRIDNFIAAQTKYETIIDQLEQQLPADVAVTTLHIAGKDISIGVTSGSLLSLQVFQSNVSSQLKSVFPSVLFHDITFESIKKDYMMTLAITTNE